jgi:hypothetical protein
MRILFFDDDTNRHEWFFSALVKKGIEANCTPVHSILTAKLALASSDTHFDYAFLDHDMGYYFETNPIRTGVAVAQFITEMDEADRPQKIILHSFNPEGARQMLYILGGARIRAKIAAIGSSEFMSVLDEIKEHK